MCKSELDTSKQLSSFMTPSQSGGPIGVQIEGVQISKLYKSKVSQIKEKKEKMIRLGFYLEEAKSVRGDAATPPLITPTRARIHPTAPPLITPTPAQTLNLLLES